MSFILDYDSNYMIKIQTNPVYAELIMHKSYNRAR